jgi:predicted Fe-Mo cluster-binding NifX family protein
MKIAVSSTGTDLSATIDERFGRCRHFLIVETDDMSVEVMDNTNAELSSSAGIQSASQVANAGAKVVITGNCGPKAMQVFNQTQIPVILGQHGVIRDVIETFKKGDLDASTSGNLPQTSGKTASAAPQAAWGSGRGGGRGVGGGRGMGGGGRGMGMGRRCAGTFGANQPGAQPSAAPRSKQEELAQLQQQADELKRQMAAIEAKIKDLT